MISVCIITYNQKAFIRQCLDSVLMQQCTEPMEVIVCDDASSDGTSEICAEYAAANPGLISYYRNETNIGMYGNWMKALRLAKGKYIAVCEGDDFWSRPDKLAMQVLFLDTNPQYAIHCGHATLLAADEKVNGNPVHQWDGGQTDFDQEDLICDNIVVTCTACFRNVGFEAWPARFNKGKVVDWFVWNYILERSWGKVYYAPDVLGSYRIHATGVYTAMNEEKKVKSYLINLGILKRWTSKPEYKKLVFREMQKYQIKLFRLYLESGRRLNSGRLLASMFFSGTPERQWQKLAHEYVIGRRK